MNPRERCIRELKKLGFIQIDGTKHDRFFSVEMNYAVTVSRSSHFDEDDSSRGQTRKETTGKVIL